MALNPYAKYLNGRDPIDVLASTYGHIARLTLQMPEEQLALGPASARWSAREIVAHLADCELVFGFRLRQTLAEDGPTVQPFDQNKWARRYGDVEFGSAVRLFSALRDWNLLLIRGTTAADRQREMTHPERGTMTFWNVVETMAGHDLNHLGALERLVPAAPEAQPK